MKDYAPRGEMREPSLKPMHRRCWCEEQVPVGQWAQHVDRCEVRAKKQDAAKAKKQAN